MIHFLLTVTILRLLIKFRPNLKFAKIFWKSSKPCYVGIPWIALAEYSQTSTHVPGFQSIFKFFAYNFVLAKLAPSSIKVNSTFKEWNCTISYFLKWYWYHYWYLLTLMLLVANLVNGKWCQKPEKMIETLAYGYSSESTQWGLFNEYKHDRV